MPPCVSRRPVLISRAAPLYGGSKGLLELLTLANAKLYSCAAVPKKLAQKIRGMLRSTLGAQGNQYSFLLWYKLWIFLRDVMIETDKCNDQGKLSVACRKEFFFDSDSASDDADLVEGFMDDDASDSESITSSDMDDSGGIMDDAGRYFKDM